MSLVVFQHIRTEDPCMLGAVLQHRGHRIRVVRLYDGDPIPPDMDDVDGVISMGGPMNVDQGSQYPWLAGEMDYLRRAHEARIPIVGVCLGAQLIATSLGGEVAAMNHAEVGWHTVKLAFPGTMDPIHAGIGWETMQFHLHGQEVTQLPTGAIPLSGSIACRHQAFRVGLTTYAFQYHFEWDMHALRQMTRDPLIPASGLSASRVLDQALDYYDDYRRLGDRLSETLATHLFLTDKR